NAAGALRFSRYDRKPQNVSPAAATSRWARELCTKKTGQRAVQSVAASATREFEIRSANRKIPNRQNAAITSIAVRVTMGAKPANFQHAASNPITNGGGELERVD